MLWPPSENKQEGPSKGVTRQTEDGVAIARSVDWSADPWQVEVTTPSAWRSSLKTGKKPDQDQSLTKTAVLVFQILKQKTAKRPVHMDRFRPVQTGLL